MIKKNIKRINKVQRGSILAYSLIVLSMMLAVATAISSSVIVEKKSAGQTEFSVQALQAADSGAELAMKKINEGANLTSLVGNVFACGAAGVVNGLTLPPSTATYDLYFYKDKEGTLPVNCATERSNDIVVIKSIGTYNGTARSVSMNVGLGGIDQAKADLKLLVERIKLARTTKMLVTGAITGNFCSECTCRQTFLPKPPMVLLGIADSTPCYATWLAGLTAIETKSGSAPGSLTNLYARDPWGSPYLLDENENEFPADLCRMDRISTAGPDGMIGTGDDLAETVPFYSIGCP